MRYLLILLAGLIPAYAISAQWGTRGCAVAQKPLNRTLEWRQSLGNADQLTLWQADRALGAWLQSEQTYWPWDGRQWGEACAPPIPIPFERRRPRPVPKPKEQDAVTENHGLVLDKLYPCPDGNTDNCPGHYTIKGRTATKAQVLEAIEKGLPDDRNKLRLTVIGTQAKRDEVRRDLYAMEQKDLADQLLLYDVGPDHWSLKDSESGKMMFACAADPTLYLQQPDGKVLARQDGYNGPKDLQAIRKQVKPYDPSKDPDPRKPPEPKKPEPGTPNIDLSQVPHGVWALLTFLAALFGIKIVLPKGQ